MNKYTVDDDYDASRESPQQDIMFRVNDKDGYLACDAAVFHDEDDAYTLLLILNSGADRSQDELDVLCAGFNSCHFNDKD